LQNDNATNGSSQKTGDNVNQDDNDDHSGAHVPTIVLNADEAERRSQILVLGSVAYMEAQSNVKLFSFMLLMISTMELLNLLAIFMGVPQEQAAQAGMPAMQVDDVFVNMDDDMYATHHAGGGGDSSDSSDGNNYNSSSSNSAYDGTKPYLPLEQNPWGWANIVDLFLSLLGVYVALVGIRAASETRLALAKVYMTGTILVGVGWMLFNYYLTVQMDEAMQDEQERDYESSHHNGSGASHHHQHSPSTADDDGSITIMTDQEIYKSALSVMVLPGLVWFMCCLRAAQFHNLLRDAEMEASTRIQSQMQLNENDNDGEQSGGTNGSDAEHGGVGSGSTLPAVV
jgi:hypothetical protein